MKIIILVLKVYDIFMLYVQILLNNHFQTNVEMRIDENRCKNDFFDRKV